MKEGKIETVEKPLFVKNKHELEGLLKQIAAGSGDAVDLLIKTMKRPDEEVSLKNKLECAKALIDFHKSIADQISKDQLTRQIAEIKAKGIVGMGSTAEKIEAPRTDFLTIQEV